MTRVAHSFGLLALVFAVGCGCSPESGVTYVPVEKGAERAVSKPPTGSETSPSPLDTKGEPGKSSEPPKVPDLNVPKDTFKISPPGAKGFKASSTPMRALGQKMDQALASLTNAFGEADTVMEVKGARLAGRSTVKVRDAKTYKIEYYDPRTEATLNRIIANGKQRVSFFKDTWTRLPAPGTATKPAGDLAEAWPTEFLSLMFDFYASDTPVWAPLLEKLETGGRGFKATIEEQTMKVLGKDRLIYRVVADRRSDGAKVEILVDGVRHLPLTIRSVIKNKAGGEDSRLWTCSWKFGGTFEDSEFVLPKATGA